MKQLRLAMVFLVLGAVPSTAFAQDPAADPAAASNSGAATTPVAKWSPEAANCADEVDNDNDGLTDCADGDCRRFLACRVENCQNGHDDDGNGKTDCADDACGDNAACNEALHCLDGKDNDLNGSFDCADEECKETPVCVAANAEAERREAQQKELVLRPFKIAAAFKALGEASKAEQAARAKLASDPINNEGAPNDLGEAIAEQIALRKQLSDLGAWKPAPKRVAAVPVSGAPAPASAPASAAVTPVAVASCNTPTPAPAPVSAAARVNYTAP